MKIRELAIKHSLARRKDAKIETETLENKIRIFEKKITINKLGELRGKKERLETIRQKHIEGVMIRSRAKWIKHGEDTSSYMYFCHLEKRNFQSKKVVSLVRDEQIEIMDAAMRTEEIKTFYTNLYKSK